MKYSVMKIVVSLAPSNDGENSKVPELDKMLK